MVKSIFLNMKCPVCTTEFQNSSGICPRCHPTTVESSDSNNLSQLIKTSSSDKADLGKMIALFALIFILFVAGVVIYLLSGISEVLDVADPQPKPTISSIDSETIFNVATPQATETPAPSPIAVSDVSGSVAAVEDHSIHFVDVVATLDESKHKIYIDFYSSVDTDKRYPDLRLNLNFGSVGGEYVVDNLSNYSVVFYNRASGFALPGKKQAIEFVRSQTWERGKDKVGLSSSIKVGEDLTGVFIHEGRVWEKEIPKLFTWNLVFRAKLHLLEN